MLSCLCLHGQAITGLEVMQRNKEQLHCSTMSYDNTLTLVNKNGQKRERSMKRQEKTDANDNKQTLIQFTQPADVKWTALLTIEHSKQDDDRWLYMPALKKSRRIPTSDISKSFMGTDFTYEDLGTEEIEEFNYEYIGQETESTSGVKCHHIVATPKTPAKAKESGYSKRELFVSADHYVVVHVKYYDKKGALIKEFRGDDLRPVGSKWRFHSLTMKDLKRKGYTQIKVRNYAIDSEIGDNVFTKGYMESFTK